MGSSDFRDIVDMGTGIIAIYFLQRFQGNSRFWINFVISVVD